jgi:hypothetical protein
LEEEVTRVLGIKITAGGANRIEEPVADPDTTIPSFAIAFFTRPQIFTLHSRILQERFNDCPWLCASRTEQEMKESILNVHLVMDPLRTP